jgi:hypothetical protein
VLNEFVPVRLVHGLLAALGYYPSKEELENINNEVRYSRYGDNFEKYNVDQINFENFVK